MKIGYIRTQYNINILFTTNVNYIHILEESAIRMASALQVNGGIGISRNRGQVFRYYLARRLVSGKIVYEILTEGFVIRETSRVLRIPPGLV